MDNKMAFELDYWKQVKTGHKERYMAILGYWNLRPVDSVLEIGTGPLGGVLPYIEARRKVGIDPLYPQYASAGLLVDHPGIEYVAEPVETFETNDRFDLVVSMNALDHGECDFSAIDRIAGWLTEGGLFCFHVHLRRPDQLNIGHDHPLTDAQLDQAITRNELRTIHRQVFDEDPIEGCAYKTVIGVWQR